MTERGRQNRSGLCQLATALHFQMPHSPGPRRAFPPFIQLATQTINFTRSFSASRSGEDALPARLLDLSQSRSSVRTFSVSASHSVARRSAAHAKGSRAINVPATERTTRTNCSITSPRAPKHALQFTPGLFWYLKVESPHHAGADPQLTVEFAIRGQPEAVRDFVGFIPGGIPPILDKLVKLLIQVS